MINDGVPSRHACIWFGDSAGCKIKTHSSSHLGWPQIGSGNHSNPGGTVQSGFSVDGISVVVMVGLDVVVVVVTVGKANVGGVDGGVGDGNGGSVTVVVVGTSVVGRGVVVRGVVGSGVVGSIGPHGFSHCQFHGITHRSKDTW